MKERAATKLQQTTSLSRRARPVSGIR